MGAVLVGIVALVALGGFLAKGKFARLNPKAVLHDPWDFSDRAKREYREGDYASARNDFEAAVKLSPKVFQFHNDLGTTLVALKDYPNARKELEIAIKLQPDSSAAYANLSLLDIETRDYSAAATAATTATKLNPEDPVAWNNLGVSSLRLRRNRDALSACRRAFELRPNELGTLNYGCALYRNGFKKEGIEKWNEILGRGTPAGQNEARFYLAHPERA